MAEKSEPKRARKPALKTGQPTVSAVIDNADRQKALQKAHADEVKASQKASAGTAKK